MTNDANLAIRMRRAAFNRALAEADIDAIGPILAQNATLVTGTDSAIIVGRKPQLLAWKREFMAADRTTYARMADSIIVSAVEPIALEHGQWQCTNVKSQRITSSGNYAAKWRRADADWVIEAEIYITLT